MHPANFRSSKFILVLSFTSMALILASSNIIAATSCKKIKGSFTLQSFSGPECLSPVGICATGTYKGDIAAIPSLWVQA